MSFGLGEIKMTLFLIHLSFVFPFLQENSQVLEQRSRKNSEQFEAEESIDWKLERYC
jgi:hypothetical protein